MSFFTLIEKEFLSLKKNLGIIIILFLVPLFIIFIMGYAFKDTEIKYNLGVINKESGKDVASAIVKNLKDVEALNIIEYDNENEAKKEIKKEEILGYIVIPKGFDDDEKKGEAKIKFVIDNSKAIKASIIENITTRFTEKFNTQATSILTAVNVGISNNPNTNPEEFVNAAIKYLNNKEGDAIELEKEYVTTDDSNNAMSSFNQTTCGMTAMFILFLCILWGSGNFLEEKLTGTMSRLYLSPVSFTTIFASKLIYIGLLGFIQFIIFFGIGHLFLDVPVGNVYLLVLLNVIFIITAAAMGLLVSIVAKSRLSAIGLSFFIIMMLSPLGGLWFPLETVPEALQHIASVLPTGSYMFAIEKIILKNCEFSDIIKNLLIIIIYFIISFILSVKMGLSGNVKPIKVKENIQ